MLPKQQVHDALRCKEIVVSPNVVCFRCGECEASISECLIYLVYRGYQIVDYNLGIPFPPHHSTIDASNYVSILG